MQTKDRSALRADLALRALVTRAAARSKSQPDLPSRMRRALILALAAIGGSAALAGAQDAVYINASIHTADDDAPRARAMAIKDGRIAAIGDERDVLAAAGDGAEIIDLAGATVLPGLIDAHGHLAGLGSLSLGVIDLSGTESYDEVIDRVEARAREVAPGEWILGRGWDHESWPDRTLPSHHALSEATPANPVWLNRVDGHAALANARAMEAAGVTRSTASPRGGEILRDQDGRPTGVFVDNAESLIERAIPSSALARAEDLILAAQDACLAAGLTGVHDMGVSPSLADLYQQIEADGRLKLRVYALISGPYAVRYFEDHEPHIGERVTIRGCKLYMDGAMGSRGAWLLDPYADRSTGPAGEPYTGLAVSEPDLIESVATHALAKGYQVCTHAIGDRANREVLDAYERAFLDMPWPEDYDHRFRIEHAQLLHPDDIKRFRQMGVIPSMQPTHCTSDMRWVEARVGADRARGACAWRSLIDSGAIIAGGSDFPVESHNPFLGFYAAITRQNPAGEPSGGWFPEHRMTREEALKSMTIWSAHAAFEEDIKGSLTPGKLADFIIIDRDIMTCPPADVLDTRVLRTVVGGEVVYQAEGP
jgi:predicted amidohydrolase YtcJ